MSSINREVLDFSFNAAADMSPTSGGVGPNTSFQFCIVKVTANNLEVTQAGAGNASVGVLQNQPKAGEAAVVRLDGITSLIVDGSGTAITPGTLLKADASGRGIPITADKDNVIAEALENSTAANDMIAAIVRKIQASQ